MKGKAHIGTSGFTYRHWKHVFYPPDVPQKRWLEYFAEHFDTVEINSSYYHMPRASVCAAWKHRTPEGFLFVMKMNGLVTHRRRLVGVEGMLTDFLAAVDELGEKLGPVLVQLPPRFGADVPRLDSFLRLCPGDYRWAVEFRDPSWLCEEVYGVLRRHNAALVVHDLIADHPRQITADFVYIRYHGPQKYSGCYPDDYLRAQGRQIRKDLRSGRDVYAYFNNDVEGFAVRNAATLRDCVAQ
jgi:uncharacterized protein YecE (DUF72 family)